MSDYSEDSMVEQPAIELFSELDWQTANCFYEKFGENGTLGRETSGEVVLLQRLIDEAEIDPDQETKFEREFAREYHLITRDDRLEKIARDIVAHFMGRGQLGKALVVSIDKA